MIGLIVLISISLYFLIGSWGFKGLGSKFGSEKSDITYIAVFLFLAASLGLSVTALSFSFYSGERVYGFSLMAGYAMKCPLIVLLPFLISLGVSVGQKSQRSKYLAKVIAASLPFNVVYFFTIGSNLISYFGITTYN